MTATDNRISIQVGLSGYSFKIEGDTRTAQSGWMGPESVFTVKELQRRYSQVDISVLSPYCALVPQSFHSPESSREQLCEVVNLPEDAFGGGFGGGFSMEDIFSQFGDIFGGHFGGFSSRGGGARMNRGSDIRVKVKLTLSEIANGATKKLKINKTIACDKCGGTGAKDSSSYASCSTCGGSGYVTRVENTFFGRMQTQGVCPTCNGSGKVITAKCDNCSGEGVMRGDEVIEINIPAGVGEGMAVTVSGKGNAARNGGVNGDLLVMIEEEHNPELVRDGNDLIHNLNLPVTTCILGGEVEVPTIDSRVKIKIAPGTHAGKVLRLRGKGLPDVNGYGRGDILIVVDITIPDTLNKEERQLVEKLAAQPHFKNAENVDKQNIFERMRNFFR